MERITKAVERARQDSNKTAVEQNLPFTSGPTRPNAKPIKSIPVSRDHLRENRIIIGDENDANTHAYKVLRTRLWQQMRSNAWSSLAITSANSGEGKTLTAINLAISLSRMQIGRTVVLVDLDLRRPKVHDYFGFWPDKGVSDYFQGGATLDEVLVDPGIGEFVLLPGNVPVMNSSEILSSPRLQRLLHEIKLRFPSRLVIFDLPPLLVTDDVLVFAPSVDALLLVLEEGRTQMEDITKAAELLKDANLIGTVLNKSEESTHIYGY